MTLDRPRPISCLGRRSFTSAADHVTYPSGELKNVSITDMIRCRIAFYVIRWCMRDWSYRAR